MIDHRLDRINLDRGSHKNPNQGICVMEAASMLAGERFSDHPKCVSNVIGQFLRTWNDALDDDDRQMLRPYALRVLGTNASEEIEGQRLYLALDWLVCICIPMWLRFISLTDHAEVLESLAPIQTAGDAGIAIDYLNRAEDAATAYAARAADAADNAAADSADAYTAALYAADAAYAAAGAAGGITALYVAAAAGDAANGAYAVAYTAAAAADAVVDAGPCGKDFFDALQQSAFDLLDRMIALKPGIWNPAVQETEVQKVREVQKVQATKSQTQVLQEVTV